MGAGDRGCVGERTGGKGHGKKGWQHVRAVENQRAAKMPPQPDL